MADQDDEVEVAAEAFMHWLVELAQEGLSHPAGRTVPEPGAQVTLFEEIGRIQWREGRELSTLLSAYQVGARVAWHHVSGTALDTGVAPEALAALAEAVFVFVDQLSSASARGFVMEQSEAAVTRERLRDELVDLLLSDRSDTAAVRAAATRAGWALPREAAVILIDQENPIGQAMLSRLDSSCLLIRRRTLHGAIVPDPVRPGPPAAAGPDAARRGRGRRPPGAAGAPAGQRPHRRGGRHAAADRGARRGPGLRRRAPRRDHRAPRRAAAGRAAPPGARSRWTRQSPAVRARLTDTLVSWLRHQGDRQAIAAELHIHPQTVRYRMTQLHELFGPSLDDPATRARLILALAWGPTDPPG